MAAEPIHVEAWDEVPAVIERIRRSAADEVQLVLPPQARFGQSRFNFQLLRQYSTRLGKRVAIWSPDPAVQRLAEESGFGAFRPDVVAPAPAARAPRHDRSPRRGSLFPGRSPGPAGPEPGASNPYAAPVAGPAAASRLGGVAGIARPGVGHTAANARIRIGAVGRRLPSRITQYQPARFALYAAAVLVLLAGVLAVLFYVPTATVTLVAQAQPFSTAADVTGDTTGKSAVHVRVVTISNRTDSLQMAATGAKVIPGQLATGQFTYVNSCTQDYALLQNQYLRSASGMEFYQTSGDVVVRASSQTTVDVRATKSGAAGNVAAGQIGSIEHNSVGCLSGANQSPTSGGTDDQKQTVIQTSDIQGARATLEQRLRQAITTELSNGAQKGETLVGPPQFTTDNFNTTHNVDDNVPSFTATLQLNAEGDYYVKDDVDRVFTDRLATKVPAGDQLTTNKVIATYSVVASPGGHLDFNGSANGYIAPSIDVQKIKAQLAGKPATQAHDVLTRLPVQRSVISQSPPLPLMPLSASRIYIDYGVEAQAPAKSS